MFTEAACSRPFLQVQCRAPASLWPKREAGLVAWHESLALSRKDVGSCLTLLIMKSLPFSLFLLSAAGWYSLAGAQTRRGASDEFTRSTQMIVVTTSNWNSVEGRLQRYERATAQESWRPVGGSPIPIVVGKNGLGWGIGVSLRPMTSESAVASEPVKREGDGKSPAGVFALAPHSAMLSQPLPGLKMPYLNLTSSIECVDDSGSKYYNRIVDRSAVAPDWNSSEHMRNVGEAYRWGIVVDHNGTVTDTNANPPVPGGGSCVFLHIWHSHDQGTAGCTAMRTNRPAKPCSSGSIRRASHCWYNYRQSAYERLSQSLDVAEIDRSYLRVERRYSISTVRGLRTSHSGSDTVSNPCSRSATTRWVDRETLFFHGLAQQGAASALLGRATGVVGIGAIGHLIVAAGHLHFLAGFQIVQGQVHGASAVMFGARRPDRRRKSSCRRASHPRRFS